VQDDDARPQLWRDVQDEAGGLIVFDDPDKARARLDALFPILTKMEKFAAGPKRARVVIMNPYDDLDQEKED
jgi:hypothetical protein